MPVNVDKDANASRVGIDGNRRIATHLTIADADFKLDARLPFHSSTALRHDIDQPKMIANAFYRCYLRRPHFLFLLAASVSVLLLFAF